MSWIDSGGSPVSEPPLRGSGSTAIEPVARMGLSAGMQLDYEKQGLQSRLDCPAKNAIDALKGPIIGR
jgi:hypothetical protein